MNLQKRADALIQERFTRLTAEVRKGMSTIKKTYEQRRISEQIASGVLNGDCICGSTNNKRNGSLSKSASKKRQSQFSRGRSPNMDLL
jgi:hypothetical protein